MRAAHRARAQTRKQRNTHAHTLTHNRDSPCVACCWHFVVRARRLGCECRARLPCCPDGNRQQIRGACSRVATERQQSQSAAAARSRHFCAAQIIIARGQQHAWRSLVRVAECGVIWIVCGTLSLRTFQLNGARRNGDRAIVARLSRWDRWRRRRQRPRRQQ